MQETIWESGLPAKLCGLNLSPVERKEATFLMTMFEIE